MEERSIMFYGGARHGDSTAHFPDSDKVSFVIPTVPTVPLGNPRPRRTVQIETYTVRKISESTGRTQWIGHFGEVKRLVLEREHLHDEDNDPYLLNGMVDQMLANVASQKRVHIPRTMMFRRSAVMYSNENVWAVSVLTVPAEHTEGETV